MLLSQPTLVLNKSWQAICTTTVKRAIILVYTDRAKIIHPDTFEMYDLNTWSDLSNLKNLPRIHSVNISFIVPEVVILTDSNVMPRPKIVFSRRNIFKRDQYTCQYCGAHPRIVELTIDHILPRSRGGLTNWENCVVSCRDCNEKKGGRTPEEIGFQLRSKPRKPAWLPFVGQTMGIRPSWEKFIGDLYWNVELDQSND